MKKTFPIEDIISFTTGRLISLGHQKMMSGPMHDIGGFVLGINKIDPYDLLNHTNAVSAELGRQHPFLNGFELEPPADGWESLREHAPLKVYVDALHRKLGKKTLDIESAPGIANTSVRTITAILN